MRAISLSLLAATFFTATSWAQEFKPAIVYSTGGKFDKSFNEAAYHGAEKFKAETGVAYNDFEPESDAQVEQALRNFASRGFNPVVAMSFSSESAVETVAGEFPDTQFVIIDAGVELPNVRSIAFKEQEGSYLVGLLAAMKSETGKIGFVGGMDIPLIRRFACGYKQGARDANPDIQFVENMTGTTRAAWSDPVRGGELAKGQIDQGVDVIYAAAGGTGLGVLQVVADNGKFSIGVDSNQNYLQPGSVLTSMVKAVDKAIYSSFADAKAGTWTAGVQILGVAEDGVRHAVDEHNERLITPEMQAAVEKAKADIIAGAISVHDYMSDNSCPY